MEVEERLLAAIDQLANDGNAGEIRLLAAILACRGKVEMRSTGWQQPFRDFVEGEGAAAEPAIKALVNRGIVLRFRGAIALNSDIMRYNKEFVATRCANRLFARTFSTFAPMLRQVPHKILKDLARNQSVTAENRARRLLGHKLFEQLHRAGIVVTSNRTNPYIFPTLRWAEHIPWTTGVAMTLEQGKALTWTNCLNDCGTAFYLALATGYLEADAERNVTVSPRGRELGHEYIEQTARRRLRWIAACREETMHLLLDQLSAPLPAFWIDGKASEVAKSWFLEPAAPHHLLFKDRLMRQWMRRLVRRLEKMGLAQEIVDRTGFSRYFFAPGVAVHAKCALDLPVEPVRLPDEHQEAFLTGFHLLRCMTKGRDGVWRLTPDAEALPAGQAERWERGVQRLKRSRQIGQPEADGSYLVKDPMAYRETVMELFVDPVTEFLTTLPEEAENLAPADGH